MRDRLLIKVEGFEQQRLLNECLKQGIGISKIRIISNVEMSLTVDGSDWERFYRLFRNRYRITIVRNYGIVPFLRKLCAKKSIWAGMLILLFLLIYQGMFISEIRIYGYERITEEQLREELRHAGLYEGAKKSLDPNLVEIEMFKMHDDISWIGIKYVGSLAEVTVVEKRLIEEETDKNHPCHIVAKKEGYIQKVIPREGLQAVETGDFVRKGDIVITGMMPITDTTYSTDPQIMNYNYVHAEGQVLAKVIYRHEFFQEAKESIKKPTGRRIPGFILKIGQFSLDSNRIFNLYDISVLKRKTLIDSIIPIPVNLKLTMEEEVTISSRKRDKESIERQVREQIRWWAKDNLTEKTQILNNSLKFSVEENIIVVTVITEALEEIGLEQPITIPNGDENEADENA
ncbi:MAG: sporulation protein YqfD [Anaerovoracaceae bacterium]|jgi:similar to stage IV sporulation protein